MTRLAGVPSVLGESTTAGDEFTNRRHGRDTMATIVGRLASARTAAARSRTRTRLLPWPLRGKDGFAQSVLALRMTASRC